MSHTSIHTHTPPSLSIALFHYYLLPPLLSFFPSADWKHRYGALMAVSAIAEGCEKQMTPILNDVVTCVLPYCQDAVSVWSCDYHVTLYSTRVSATLLVMLSGKCLRIFRRRCKKSFTIRLSPRCSQYWMIFRTLESSLMPELLLLIFVNFVQSLFSLGISILLYLNWKLLLNLDSQR